MTTQSLFESLDAVRRLWSIFAIGPAPEDKQLAIWLEQFTEAELLHAFRRVGTKFRDGNHPSDALYRYATGVLVGERKSKQTTQAESTRVGA